MRSRRATPTPASTRSAWPRTRSRSAPRVGQQWAGSPEIEFGFLLHDIGKVAVPDSILHKPEPLTPQERELIQLHPVTGWEIVRQVDFLGAASDVVRHHHERWDGDGYPDGLKGEDIPLTARVFAVADTLDALTTDAPVPAGVAARPRRGR